MQHPSDLSEALRAKIQKNIYYVWWQKKYHQLVEATIAILERWICNLKGWSVKSQVFEWFVTIIMKEDVIKSSKKKIKSAHKAEISSQRASVLHPVEEVPT